MRILLALFGVALFTGCITCNPKELAKSALLPDEINLNPYQVNDVINMQHSGGIRVKFAVKSRVSDFKKSINCTECCRNFVSVQFDETTMSADYPKMDIIYALRKSIVKWPDSFTTELSIKIAQSAGFNLINPLNTKTIDSNHFKVLDSVIIQSKVYYHVYEYCNKSATDMYLKDLLFNKEKGIIRFEYGNSEYYELK